MTHTRRVRNDGAVMLYCDCACGHNSRRQIAGPRWKAETFGCGPSGEARALLNLVRRGRASAEQIESSLIISERDESKLASGGMSPELIASAKKFRREILRLFREMTGRAGLPLPEPPVAQPEPRSLLGCSLAARATTEAWR